MALVAALTVALALRQERQVDGLDERLGLLERFHQGEELPGGYGADGAAQPVSVRQVHAERAPQNGGTVEFRVSFQLDNRSEGAFLGLARVRLLTERGYILAADSIRVVVDRGAAERYGVSLAVPAENASLFRRVAVTL